MSTSPPALPSLEFLEVERRMPIMTLPLRTVVVALSDARVLLSPASTLDAEQLRSVGAITDIVAPNLFHLDGVPAAAAAHPDARVWGPEGAAEKLPTVAWTGVLGRDPWPHERELSHVLLAGMPTVRESVFLHHASRALLVTDLVFHIEQPQGLGARVVLGLFGTWGRFGVSRLYARLIKDPVAFGGVVGQLAAMDFDHVVPAHGSILSVDAKARLLAALLERGYAPG